MPRRFFAALRMTRKLSAMNIVTQSILEILKKLYPKRVGLHEPYFSGNENAYVKECIDTGWVSSVGKFVDKFEAMIAEFTGVKKAVACVNGTAALQVCLKLAGVNPGDEVLMPALTFAATANAVTYAQGVPHFVDCEEATLGVDPEKLDLYLREIGERDAKRGFINKKTGRRIAALVPVHIFGHPVRLDELVAVCEKYGITLVEDAAESLGSYYKGRHTGNFGLLAATSFNGNKIITTGGGGMILTNNEELGKRAKHITTTAKVPHAWEYVHDEIGYNYRLPNLNSALGCAQMELLPKYLENKRKLAARYAETFKSVSGVDFFVEKDFAKTNYWLNAIILKKENASCRDEILAVTNENNIMTRPVWRLMHKMPMFENCPRMPLDVSESLEARVINIPSSVFLANE